MDYLAWRGDVPLHVAPFNPVDNLIMSMLSYLSLEDTDGCLISEVWQEVCDKEPDEALCGLIRAMGEGARFGGMRLAGFEEQFSEEEEKQFAAVLVDLGDGSHYASFRGTDATLIGWKEDFNMSFADEIPAQQESARYLNRVARLSRGPLRLGGHSKGGNLAVYAALFCEKKIRARICEIYNNDGPGMTPKMLRSPAYPQLEPRIRTYLPQSSVIGMLLEHTESYQVVSSRGFGLMQHDPFTWQTARSDFVKEGGLRAGSLYMDKTIKDWVRAVSPEERKQFIDAVYRILTSTGAKSINDLATGWHRNMTAILSETSGFDPETRRLLRRIVRLLFATGARNLMPAGARDHRQA
jgi:hypothetical protein